MATHRVMQVTETNEEFCVFTGSESECDDWIDENSDNYPESGFYTEKI